MPTPDARAVQCGSIRNRPKLRPEFQMAIMAGIMGTASVAVYPPAWKRDLMSKGMEGLCPLQAFLCSLNMYSV